jgi:F0F1-type ATP synthase membrane subunit b/b'
VHEARARAEAAVAQARAALNSEVEALKKNLEAESVALADRIASKILRGRAA